MPTDPPELSDADDALIMIIRAIKKYGQYADPADAVATAICVLDEMSTAGLTVIRAAEKTFEYRRRNMVNPSIWTTAFSDDAEESRAVVRGEWRPAEGSQT